MKSIEANNFPDKIAKTVSFILHPLFMPVYGMAIIFSAPTLLGYLPFQVKKILFFVIVINNVLLPLSFLPFFKYKNVISSWIVENRRERIIPLLITSILYGTTSYIIMRFPVPAFLKSYFFAAFFVSVAVTVINFWWKISIHSVGAGALIAAVLFLSFKMYTPLIWHLVAVILAGGVVMSSRLWLNTHNTRQIWLGFLTGFLGLILFMMFL
jgi:hypothetical protein